MVRFILLIIWKKEAAFVSPRWKTGMELKISIGERPWSVNAMAIEAGKFFVKNNPQMIPDLKAYLAEAQRLHRNLSAVDGLMVMKTDTNFMLVNIDEGNTPELKKWLIDNYGILIRDASNFRGLDDHCFRVTAQTPEENDALVEALKAYLAWKRENQ